VLRDRVAAVFACCDSSVSDGFF